VSERLPEERHLLRQTFDDGSAEYDRARPVAPDHVFDDLVSLAEVGAGGRLLEIGCGTGQNTTPLAERGFEIVAVELGESLAELARRNLAAFPNVTVVTSSFEEWDPGDERFDAVVSFNAFHWVDPEVAYSKSAAVLRDGGALGSTEPASRRMTTPTPSGSRRGRTTSRRPASRTSGCSYLSTTFATARTSSPRAASPQ
jgi:cyclopropane fatty-acyl-phospholipid synthase-like methyltransferase